MLRDRTRLYFGFCRGFSATDGQARGICRGPEPGKKRVATEREFPEMDLEVRRRPFVARLNWRFWVWGLVLVGWLWALFDLSRPTYNLSGVYLSSGVLMRVEQIGDKVTVHGTFDHRNKDFRGVLRGDRMRLKGEEDTLELVVREIPFDKKVRPGQYLRLQGTLRKPDGTEEILNVTDRPENGEANSWSGSSTGRI